MSDSVSFVGVDEGNSFYFGANNLARARLILDTARHEIADCKSLISGLSVIVLTKDKPNFILPLLEQLLQAQDAFMKRGSVLNVFIGDTGSSDPRVLGSYENSRREIHLLSELNYHFSRNNNDLAHHVRTDTLLFLNNDMRFKDATASLWAMKKAVQAASPFEIFGAQLRFESGTCQHSGIYFSRTVKNWALPYHLGAGDGMVVIDNPLDVPAVTGAFLAIRTVDFHRLGGFEKFYAAECQDVDLCLKARRLGGKSTLLNLGEITHFENGTRDPGEVHPADRAHFLRRWRGFIEENFLLEGASP